ncbi:MAG: serine/threonine protein kinase [Sandaracinaceae bacterium]|nr:serine/threonine protein kinase [Sandaracinaceae bacterium]
MRDARRSTAPATFGRYQTLLRIAAGGMAEVYAARALGEAGFEKLVAVKRMLPHLADDERFATMFMDEGRLAAHIDSPHVVSTIDLGRADDGSFFLVMELVIGTTLSVLLRNAAARSEPIPIGAACEMVAQAAQGLHDAHEARTPLGAPLELVHRDVSPQNILCGLDGRVRITDFGVARAVLRRTKSNTGELKGKLSYFSPEQCKNQLLDRRSDIFALGVVAWEALTCRPLFQSENPLAVLDRVMQMPIPAVSAVRAEVAEPISAVVARALERDRERRFQTAYEFASALRRAAVESLGSVDPRSISSLVERLGATSSIVSVDR